MASKTGLCAEDIRRDELYGIVIKAAGESVSYGDPHIEAKIRAAEDFYEHDLNILFGKHRIISMARERGIIVDPDADPPEIEEPGYDYDKGLYEAERWAFIHLNHRPIIPDPDADSGISRVIFSFPSAQQPIFEIPQIWIKPNFKYGEINLIPATGAVFASFTSFFLQTATGGAYGVPKVILIDYFAGIEKDRLKKDHADLLQGVKLRTWLMLAGIAGNIISGGLMSGSLSLDGLSHSRGFGGKWGPYSGAIELAMEEEKQIRESWKRHHKGIIFTVL